MKAVTQWIVSLFINDWKNVRNPSVRSGYGILEGWVSIVGNLLLAGVKMVMGIALQSAGLIADAVHSFSDMASSVVVIFSFKTAGKPPDKEHPFGHARIEYVATLIVALLMIMAGFQIITDAVGSLGEMPEHLDPLSWELFAVLVFLMISKEAMALFSNELGRMIDSKTLEADGWHHRSDALSTGVVILGLAGRNWGITWLDPAAGVLVGLWIVYIAFKMAWEAISPLLGEMIPAEDLEEIKDIAKGVEGVMDTHDLMVHKYGHFYFTAIHVEISDELSVHQMHDITVLIETRLLKRFPGQCVVHVDPINKEHPLHNFIAEALKETVLAHPSLVEFRDLNLWHENGREHGKVEVSVEEETDPDTFSALAGHIQEKVQDKFPDLTLNVDIKIDFSAVVTST
ncbi:MAG: cation diffusion facilitator family transporter [Deltaproteobacteria bacterium]|nr:cation diffusion facilitator family transporter [Deltaproteobacteria bacterium]